MEGEKPTAKITIFFYNNNNDNVTSENCVFLSFHPWNQAVNSQLYENMKFKAYLYQM